VRFWDADTDADADASTLALLRSRSGFRWWSVGMYFRVFRVNRRSYRARSRETFPELYDQGHLLNQLGCAHFQTLSEGS
jgi:hypothetical protein